MGLDLSPINGWKNTLDTRRKPEPGMLTFMEPENTTLTICDNLK